MNVFIVVAFLNLGMLALPASAAEATARTHPDPICSERDVNPERCVINDGPPTRLGTAGEPVTTPPSTGGSSGGGSSGGGSSGGGSSGQGGGQGAGQGSGSGAPQGTPTLRRGWK